MTEHLDPGTDPGALDDETARTAVPAPADTTPAAQDPVPAAPTSPLTPASRLDSGTTVHEGEVAWARGIVEAFEGQSEGVLAVNGTMVDRPVVERALRILAEAEAQ